MFFCKRCGSLMRPKTEGNKKIMLCGNCGYKEEAKEVKFTEKPVVKEKEIEVIEKEEEILPLTSAECPKCKHRKAYFWLVQTRAGDEPETKFLRCEKCRHTWRDYS